MKSRQLNIPGTDEVVNSKWRGLLDPNTVPPKETGWFGDEFGRALARCAEVGIRSTVLLRRDLDRLLVVLGGATLQLAGFKRLGEEGTGSAKDTALPEEAGFLLDRIAEIGMYAFQVSDEAYSDWFVRPALVLASLENKLEGINVQVSGPPFLENNSANGEHPHTQKHCLAGRALAAWCLVNYTFEQFKNGSSAQREPTIQGRDRLGGQAQTCPQLWIEAKRLAESPAMYPSWMPLVRNEPNGEQQLNEFVDKVQKQIIETPQNRVSAGRV